MVAEGGNKDRTHWQNRILQSKNKFQKQTNKLINIYTRSLVIHQINQISELIIGYY